LPEQRETLVRRQVFEGSPCHGQSVSAATEYPQGPKTLLPQLIDTPTALIPQAPTSRITGVEHPRGTGGRQPGRPQGERMSLEGGVNIASIPTLAAYPRSPD
jgi:hypothetical protein